VCTQATLRLYAQGELQGSAKATNPALGAGRLAAGIVRDEGLRGLYAGLAPAVVRGQLDG